MRNELYQTERSVLDKIDGFSDMGKYTLICELLKVKPYNEELINYVVLSIKDNNFLLEYLKVIPLFFPAEIIMNIFKKLSDDYERLEGMDNYFNHPNRMYLVKDVLTTFDDDINKQAFFHLLSIPEKVEVIKSLKSDNEKILYIENKKYKDFKADIICSLTNKKLIANYFNEITDMKFALELIRKTTDPDLKKAFINALGFEDLSNFWEDTHSIFDEVNECEKDNIDPNISIGVELEVCHKYIDMFKLDNVVFEDYTITEDESLENGFEIVSPILHYTNKDMSKLRKVCDTLNNSHFYTNGRCGGHIHIGANYLSNIENYKTLLYIYCNCENIFYLISNKTNTKLRKKSKYFANKVKNLYIKSLEKGLLNENEENLDAFLNSLVRINGKRDKGMNLRNLGDIYKNTIEFRIPNGEIYFEELKNNIKLFAKLIEKSKELSSDEISDKDKSLLTALNIPCTDDEKLEILLGLLFDNEKDKSIYRERYESNKNTKQRVISKHYKDKRILNFY